MRSKVFPQEAGARCVALVKGQVAKQNHVALRVHSEARFLGWFWCFLVGLDCEDKSARTRTDSETLVFMKKRAFISYSYQGKMPEGLRGLSSIWGVEGLCWGHPHRARVSISFAFNHEPCIQIQKYSEVIHILHEIAWNYMNWHAITSGHK